MVMVATTDRLLTNSEFHGGRTGGQLDVGGVSHLGGIARGRVDHRGRVRPGDLAADPEDDLGRVELEGVGHLHRGLRLGRAAGPIGVVVTAAGNRDEHDDDTEDPEQAEPPPLPGGQLSDLLRRNLPSPIPSLGRGR